MQRALTMAIDAMNDDATSCGLDDMSNAHADFDAGSDQDALTWTERLVAASRDYESIDLEAVAGLKCGPD